MLPLPIFIAAALLAACRAAWCLGFPVAAKSLLLATSGATAWTLRRPAGPRRALFLRGRPRLQWRSPRRGRRAPTGETCRWGGEELPGESATTHFLVAGTT